MGEVPGLSGIRKGRLCGVGGRGGFAVGVREIGGGPGFGNIRWRGVGVFRRGRIRKRSGRFWFGIRWGHRIRRRLGYAVFFFWRASGC